MAVDDFVFHSYAANYDRNISDGEKAQVNMATLAGPQGLEAAIAIRVGQYPRLVVPTSDALRIANDIADAATRQRETS